MEYNPSNTREVVMVQPGAMVAAIIGVAKGAKKMVEADRIHLERLKTDPEYREAVERKRKELKEKSNKE